MNLCDKACQFSEQVLRDFEDAEIATKQQIEDADGRIGSNPISERGSYVYAAYDASDRLLYVGETGKSITNRFITDGSGAHKEKSWYQSMANVKFKKLNPNEEEYRKLLEKALIYAGKPICQN